MTVRELIEFIEQEIEDWDNTIVLYRALDDLFPLRVESLSTTDILRENGLDKFETVKALTFP